MKASQFAQSGASPLKSRDRRIIGLKHNQSGRPVDNDLVAIFNIAEHIANSNHNRNADRRCNDGCMIGTSAGFEHDGHNTLA